MAGQSPLRILTAVPVCDGHDSAINTINLELVRSGVEVIYLGYHRTARDMVRAAIQEGASAIGISSYNGGHIEFFREVRELLVARGAGAIGLFGGGGGTITAADAKHMMRHGTDRIFFAGTPLEEIVTFVHGYADRTRKPIARETRTPKKKAAPGHVSDGEIAQMLAALALPTPGGGKSPRTIGIAGPGGAGKTTLIDELVRRYLALHPDHRVAILAHDPSLLGAGALLGDRATMIWSQDDRVFMRSLATQGTSGGVAESTERSLAILRSLPFDVVIVETVGIGQESVPFGARGSAVDVAVLVMSPDYGARLQLQKIVMLDVADIVVVNKGDLAGAKTAVSEVTHRLHRAGKRQRVIATVAKAHRDPGVDELLQAVMGPPALTGE